jgi:hypothetical protein
MELNMKRPILIGSNKPANIDKATKQRIQKQMDKVIRQIVKNGKYDHDKDLSMQEFIRKLREIREGL